MRGEDANEWDPAAAGYSGWNGFADNPGESASRASHFTKFTVMLGTGRIRGNYSRYFRSKAFLLAATVAIMRHRVVCRLAQRKEKSETTIIRM